MDSEHIDNTKGYWLESARPLVSLVFIAPFLSAYEAGVLLLGGDAIRNGADVWLRQILDLAGFGQYFLLPILCCGILLGWHYVTHRSWRFNPSVLYLMLIECLFFGFVLLLVARWQGSLFAALTWPCAAEVAAESADPSKWQRWIGVFAGYCGAGVYEELLFRLMLLPVTIGLLRLARVPRRWDLVCGVIITSLLFSIAHYQITIEFAGRDWVSNGEAFTPYSFFFRFSAGVFFSSLFLYRGFGITAGSHALYDIFTVFVS